MKLHIYILTFLLCLCSIGLYGQDGFRFSTIFSDNMVLQQKSKVKIWGYSAPNDLLKIEASWSRKSKTFKADSTGKWMTELSTPKGSFKNYTISLSDSEKRKIILKNVCIGEIWLCSGQSNMEMIMGPNAQWKLHVDNAEKEIASANYPMIRFINIQRKESFTPVEEIIANGWKTCDSEIIKYLSAVGYYFARRLQTNIKLPIGLIVNSYGGSPIQSWIPAKYSMDSIYNKERDIREKTKLKSTKPTYDILSCLYNGMTYPILNFKVRGWLWYQGESNVGDAKRYPKMMKDLVDSWRKSWNLNLPFYYVQIAPFKYPGYQKEKWAELAFAQENALKIIDNSYMTITADIGDSINIHPGKKKPVGDRLANLALANTYHKISNYNCPSFRKVSQENNILKIEFNNTYKGLYQEGVHQEFEISSNDITYYKADLDIKGKYISLSSPMVPAPRYVRYCWKDASISTIYNSEHLPLGPFKASI
jgi:sialate O-acetylesterase